MVRISTVRYILTMLTALFSSLFSSALANNSKSGFVCVMFYRRNAHVAELQMGTPASRLEDACAADHFDPSRLQFITLLGN